MKIAKSQLDELSKNAVKLAVGTIAILHQLKCPISDMYEEMAEVAAQANQVRQGLELEPICPELADKVRKLTASLKDKEKALLLERLAELNQGGIVKKEVGFKMSDVLEIENDSEPKTEKPQPQEDTVEVDPDKSVKKPVGFEIPDLPETDKTKMN